MATKPTQTDRILNVPATIRLGDRDLTVAALSLREERALFAELAAVVAASSDPFERAAPVLERLEAEKKHAERAVLLKAAAAAVLDADPPSDARVEAARRTTPGVLAQELYRRGKKFHRELRLDELLAVVNEGNVGDLYFELEAALSGEGDGPKA